MFTEAAEARKTCLTLKKNAKRLVTKIMLLIIWNLELWTYAALTLIPARVACPNPCSASIKKPNDVKSSFTEVIAFRCVIFLVYYYVVLSFSGCRGNENRFRTVEECVDTCGGNEPEIQNGLCSLVKCDRKEAIFFQVISLAIML